MSSLVGLTLLNVLDMANSATTELTVFHSGWSPGLFIVWAKLKPEIKMICDRQNSIIWSLFFWKKKRSFVIWSFLGLLLANSCYAFELDRHYTLLLGCHELTLWGSMVWWCSVRFFFGHSVDSTWYTLFMAFVGLCWRSKIFS